MGERAVHPLLRELFDYAGLFPPASLGMGAAVANYAWYVRGVEAWMLGRFVVPVGRLGEFEVSAREFLPAGSGDEAEDERVAWRLSGIVDGGRSLDEQIEEVFAFNRRHSGRVGVGLCEVDALELRAGEPGLIDEAMEVVPEQLEPFFEVDAGGDVRGALAALSGTGGNAKIRCGGVEAGAIPGVDRVAGFVRGCADAGVPFKFTAGLHHAVRGEQALTYEDDAPRAVTHGFLNVVVASGLAMVRGADVSTLEHCLGETDAGAFVFEGEGVSWGGETLSGDEMRRVRESFAVSIGSCSFTEPVEDLVGLGLLPGGAVGMRG